MAKLICPVITPTSEHEYRRLIQHVVADGRGCDVVFALGTTGEFYALDNGVGKNYSSIAIDEVRELNRKNRRRVEVAVGVTSHSWRESINFAKFAERCGADSLVVMPVYIEETRRFGDGLKRFLHETNKPVILYNHPGMTCGKNIRSATWKEFAQHPGIVALKDSSGNLKRLGDYQKAAGNNAEVYVGDEIFGLRCLANGMHLDGIVAGSANIFPIAWKIAVDCNFGEDIHAARFAEKLEEFQKIYAINPIGAFHYILQKQGVISSNETIDKRNKVSDKLADDLDNLMQQQDFKSIVTF